MPLSVGERRQLRSQVLRRIYDLVDGRLAEATGVGWNDEELREGLDIEPEEIEKALDYLADAGLLDNSVALGVYGLTRRGLDEIEDLIAVPEKPTAHLAPLVVQHIHNTGQLSIAHGSGISVTQTNVSQALPKEIEDLARRLQDQLGEGKERELQAFLKEAAEGSSKFELAARAEPISKSGEGAKSVLKSFTEEMGKELGKQTAGGALVAGTWLASHGQRVYDGLTLLLQTLG